MTTLLYFFSIGIEEWINSKAWWEVVNEYNEIKGLELKNMNYKGMKWDPKLKINIK